MKNWRSSSTLISLCKGLCVTHWTIWWFTIGNTEGASKYWIEPNIGNLVISCTWIYIIRYDTQLSSHEPKSSISPNPQKRQTCQAEREYKSHQLLLFSRECPNTTFSSSLDHLIEVEDRRKDLVCMTNEIFGSQFSLHLPKQKPTFVNSHLQNLPYVPSPPQPANLAVAQRNSNFLCFRYFVQFCLSAKAFIFLNKFLHRFKEGL